MRGPRRSRSCRHLIRRSGPGLFFVRRQRISIRRSISVSRPTSGSSFPSPADAVKSRVNSARLGVFDSSCAAREVGANRSAPVMPCPRRIIWSRTSCGRNPNPNRISAAIDVASRTMPSRRCSGRHGPLFQHPALFVGVNENLLCVGRKMELRRLGNPVANDDAFLDITADRLG